VLRSRVAWAHNTFVLNEHIGTDGTIDKTKLTDTYMLDDRRSEPAFRDGRDPYHLAQGGSLGRAHKGMAFWRLKGRILVPLALPAAMAQEMEDKERALLAAFDPFLCTLDSPSTEGAFALDWTEPTQDTTNFPTGIPTRLYARPTLHPMVTERLYDMAVRDFAVGLVAGDPRKYHQTESTLALTPGSPSGSVVNRGNVPSALKATIVMSAAGSATFTIARGGVSFILNLTTMVASDTVIVIFETCGPYGRGKLITKNGVENAALKTSAADTWLTVPVGSTSFSISNNTGITSCTLAWRHAWA